MLENLRFWKMLTGAVVKITIRSTDDRWISRWSLFDLGSRFLFIVIKKNLFPAIPIDVNIAESATIASCGIKTDTFSGIV